MCLGGMAWDDAQTHTDYSSKDLAGFLDFRMLVQWDHFDGDSRNVKGWVLCIQKVDSGTGDF